VCCVKYRKKVLTREISSRLKEINLSVAEKFGVQIIEQETDLDHIHILLLPDPRYSSQSYEFPQVGLRTLALQRIPRTEKGVVGRPLLVTELFSCHCGGGEAGRCQKVRPVPRQCVITGFASTLTESRSRNSLPGWRPAAGYTILHSPREKKHGKRKAFRFPDRATGLAEAG